MIGRTNVSGGASGGDVFAFIVVTYPPGSTCTATNGTTTLTATDTSGTFVFKIPTPSSTPETWTLSCTNGTVTAFTTKNISTEGQSESVSLAYSLYLIKDGVVQTGYTFANNVTYINNSYRGNITQNTGYISLSAVNGYSMVYSVTEALDLSAFNLLKATVDPRSVVTNTGLNQKLRGAGIAVFSEAYPSAGSSANLVSKISANENTITTGQQTLSCDISSLSSGLVALTVGAYSSSNGTVRVYDVWLEA